METNSSTIAVPSEVQTDDLPPTNEHRRGLVGWVFVLAGFFAVFALAIVAWVGGADEHGARTAPLNPSAERIEREAHLEGQARTYRSDGRIFISADAAERAAQAAAATPAESEPEFLPGSRRLPSK